MSRLLALDQLASSAAQNQHLREELRRADERATRAEQRAAQWEQAWTDLAVQLEEFLAAREAKGTPGWMTRYQRARTQLYETLGRRCYG